MYPRILPHTRTLAWLTALLLLLSALPSCGNGNSPDGTQTDPASAESSSTETETAVETDSLEGRKNVSDDLPAKNFNGKEYRMLYQVRYAQYQDVEELTGDALNDAIYRRNADVSDRLGIRLVHKTGEEEALAQQIQKSALSGNDEYDLYLGHTIYTGKYAVQGVFRNWYDTGIDFSKPWFPSQAIQNLTFNNRMFLTASDICLSLASNTYCMFFNRMMTESRGMENMYDVVNRGDWTIDYLLTNVASLYEDNGDGKRDAEDLYGFTADATNASVAYVYSFDLKMIDIDEDGTVSMVFGKDERSVNAIDKLQRLLKADGTISQSDPVKLFVNQKAMFTTGVLSDSVSDYRDECDFEYGILPFPKYDTAQSHYATVAGGSISCSAMPITMSDMELAKYCFTALSAETWKNVIPQYYDRVLKFRGARDEASIAMIDLILNGRNLDFAFMYDAFTGFMYQMESILKSKSSLSTYVQQREKKVLQHYEDVRNLFYEEVDA